VTDALWWFLTQRAGRVEHLTAAECRQLLKTTTIGRLGYSTSNGPRIVPMNYTVAGGRLLFRTTPDTEAGRCANRCQVAFEVDQIDEPRHAGWSVLVTGEANQITPREWELLDIFQTPDPWAEGEHPLLLQLPLTTMTGRRVLAS
jgi:nitroimidazol reductase NimA-like FMN-containing flavoprotein (pyridoxamine 5'-phosphate oxidase superfamily)